MSTTTRSRTCARRLRSACSAWRAARRTSPSGLRSPHSKRSTATTPRTGCCPPTARLSTSGGSTPMADVQFKDVDKVYENGVQAVFDLSLQIQDGEFLVLVGPSGCGKTTALRMVAGLEHVSDGTISIGERVVNSLTPKDRDIAMVFQNYALYPHLNVAE